MPGWSKRVAWWLGAVVGVVTIPGLWCSRGTDRAYAGDLDAQASLAAAVDGWIQRGFDEGAFSTGSALFDSEWIFGTYQMAALGFGQMALEHPDDRAALRERADRAVDRMLSERGRAFDTNAWHEDALAALTTRHGHVAFLGYANLVLSLHRRAFGDSRYASLNDALTRALESRYEASSSGLLETYPGQIFPVDNAAALASIALHSKATGLAAPKIAALLARFARHSVDPRTGLLFQQSAADGEPRDAPRGSGSALAAYFLSFADASLSRRLHEAVQRELATSAFGFRVVREYPWSTSKGRGDIDSGPIVFGFGVSATGFSLAGCRIHHDERCYRETLATANLFGVPFDRGPAGSTFVAGGPLGDAILFAMQTAPREQI
jgi:hypothetical protein